MRAASATGHAERKLARLEAAMHWRCDLPAPEFCSSDMLSDLRRSLVLIKGGGIVQGSLRWLALKMLEVE